MQAKWICRVVLDDQQRKFIPTTCFGETEYFADGAREVAESVSAPGQSSTPR